MWPDGFSRGMKIKQRNFYLHVNEGHSLSTWNWRHSQHCTFLVRKTVNLWSYPKVSLLVNSYMFGLLIKVQVARSPFHIGVPWRLSVPFHFGETNRKYGMTRLQQDFQRLCRLLKRNITISGWRILPADWWWTSNPNLRSNTQLRVPNRISWSMVCFWSLEFMSIIFSIIPGMLFLTHFSHAIGIFMSFWLSKHFPHQQHIHTYIPTYTHMYSHT